MAGWFIVRRTEAATQHFATNMAAATVAEADAAESEGCAGFTGVESRGWDESQLRKYSFATKPIPRLSHTDPRADILINNEVTYRYTDLGWLAETYIRSTISVHCDIIGQRRFEYQYTGILFMLIS